MHKYVKPIIERFFDDGLLDAQRRNIAETVCRYFHSNGRPTVSYYEAVASLLQQPESERILLYLPFEELADAPAFFKDAYRQTWYRLLTMYDVQENFHEGDTLEPDARPDSDFTRVVKAMHLAPWLLQAGYLNFEQLWSIISMRHYDTNLMQSINDIMPYIQQNALLPAHQIRHLAFCLKSVPQKHRQEPLYISEKRKQWLAEKQTGDSATLLTPDAALEGPFSDNVRAIRGRVIDIIDSLEPNQILLLGGSQLKGYGTVTSDLDVWDFNTVSNDHVFYAGSPDSAHIYFNTLWVGGDNTPDLADVQLSVLRAYAASSTRRKSLERLEEDLLQYRLLHKGFARVTHRRTFDTQTYLSMDGDCPFYDREYRKIATMLFAKYVYLPETV